MQLWENTLMVLRNIITSYKYGSIGNCSFLLSIVGTVVWQCLLFESFFVIPYWRLQLAGCWFSCGHWSLNITLLCVYKCLMFMLWLGCSPVQVPIHPPLSLCTEETGTLGTLTTLRVSSQFKIICLANVKIRYNYFIHPKIKFQTLCPETFAWIIPLLTASLWWKSEIRISGWQPNALHPE